MRTSVPGLAALAAAAVLTMAHPAGARQQAAPPPAAAASPAPYRAPIGLEAARRAMAAAAAAAAEEEEEEEEATRNGWGVAIAVVDSGGHLVMLHRLDGTQIASVRIAEGKARTALEFRRPTKALEDAVAGGGAGLRLLSLENIFPLEGGVPIVAGGRMVGGIGVSGVTSQQDAQVARAGAEVAAR
jgi:glc operon protein GlcG